MKTKPILFSTPMVNAIFDGSKTQTRRVIKSKHESGNFEIAKTGDGKISSITSLDWDEFPKNDSTNDIRPIAYIGDILWVREKHYAYGWWVKNGLTKTGKQKWSFADFTLVDKEGKYYYPDAPPENVIEKRVERQIGWYKRNSLFMPKEACRIFLKITNLRVERTHDISEEDAKEEGAFDMNCGIHGITDHKNGFFHLWECINGKESLESNPWVFVYDFELTDKPENFIQ